MKIRCNIQVIILLYRLLYQSFSFLQPNSLFFLNWRIESIQLKIKFKQMVFKPTTVPILDIIILVARQCIYISQREENSLLLLFDVIMFHTNKGRNNCSVKLKQFFVFRIFSVFTFLIYFFIFHFFMLPRTNKSMVYNKTIFVYLNRPFLGVLENNFQ